LVDEVTRAEATKARWYAELSEVLRVLRTVIGFYPYRNPSNLGRLPTAALTSVLRTHGPRSLVDLRSARRTAARVWEGEGGEAVLLRCITKGIRVMHAVLAAVREELGRRC
jgi:hypothetical protein